MTPDLRTCPTSRAHSRLPDRCGRGGPCTSTCCPRATRLSRGENVQAWLATLQAGRHEQAWRVLVADNPLPAIHGRVCYHPCESSCNRAELDSAVSIHAVERFLGDLALEQGWAFDPPPATAASACSSSVPARAGCPPRTTWRGWATTVEVRDAGEEPGGMMRYGIPAYRLPRDVLDARDRPDRRARRPLHAAATGSTTSPPSSGEGGFDAVFVAVGAHLAKRVDIPARDAGPIVDAVSYLRGVASGERPRLGRRVAVYGGGNTAMDAARVARRLGADEALLVYRRTPAQMPAHAEEAEDAEREGVRMNWLRTITAFEGPELRSRSWSSTTPGVRGRPAASRRCRPTP